MRYPGIRLLVGITNFLTIVSFLIVAISVIVAFNKGQTELGILWLFLGPVVILLSRCGVEAMAALVEIADNTRPVSHATATAPNFDDSEDEANRIIEQLRKENIDVSLYGKGWMVDNGSKKGIRCKNVDELQKVLDRIRSEGSKAA